MNDTVATLLDKAVDVEITKIDTDSLSKALKNLMAQIGSARKFIQVYADFNSLTKEVEEIIANSTPTVEPTRALLQNTLNNAKSEAEDAPTPADLTEIYNTLESGRQSYVVDAVPLNGIGFDLTFKVANASGTQAGGGPQTVRATSSR